MSARSAALLMLIAISGLAPAVSVGAQVINGQSTDDAAYAPRPPARWHSPEAEGEVPGGRQQDDDRVIGAQTEKPRH